MSYQSKTNWQLDDIVMPDDMNRIEGGIVDLENNIGNIESIKILEASEDNVIDFNTLTETGIYLIKNASADTTLNSGLTGTSSAVELILDVTKMTNSVGVYYYQEYKLCTSINGLSYYRIYDASKLVWNDWSKYHTAETPTANYHIANKAYVDTKATKATYTATIPTTGWTATGSHYYINITVTGILNTDSPIISPKFTGLTQAQEEACLESWNKISCIYTNANSIQVQVFEEIPTVEIPIQIMCIR